MLLYSFYSVGYSDNLSVFEEIMDSVRSPDRPKVDMDFHYVTRIVCYLSRMGIVCKPEIYKLINAINKEKDRFISAGENKSELVDAWVDFCVERNWSQLSKHHRRRLETQKRSNLAEFRVVLTLIADLSESIQIWNSRPGFEFMPRLDPQVMEAFSTFHL